MGLEGLGVYTGPGIQEPATYIKDANEPPHNLAPFRLTG